MRLLVLTRHPPLPDFDGAGAYLWDMLGYFAKAGVRIEVASMWTPPVWTRKNHILVPRQLRFTADLQFPGVLALGPWRWLRWGSVKARAIHRVRSALRKSPTRPVDPKTTINPRIATQGNVLPSWDSPPSASELKFFARRIAAFRPDVVIANFCWLAPALPNRTKGPCTAILAHDVMSDKLAPRLSAAYPFPDPATPEGEAALLAQADLTIAISEPDALVFRRLLPAAKTVVVAPMSAPLRLAPSSTTAEPGRVLFVGSQNAPNTEGLAWFCTEVWPLVRATLPSATLYVCGDSAKTLSSPPPSGIVAQGRVADLTPEYHRAAVVVVPLLKGTGVKIKLVEALAHGRPIVATPVGLQGLERFRPAVREAETPTAFATSLIRLLQQPQEAAQLAAAARRAACHLSPAACYEPVLAALRKLTP